MQEEYSVYANTRNIKTVERILHLVPPALWPGAVYAPCMSTEPTADAPFAIWSAAARPRLGSVDLTAAERELIRVIRATPKTDLHIHVEGSVDPPRPPTTPSAAGSKESAFFARWFDVIAGLATTADFQRVAEQFAGRLRAAGVVWSEAFVSPPDLAMRPHHPIPFDHALRAWVRAFTAASSPATEIRLIVDLVRLYPPEDAARWLEELLAIRKEPGGSIIIGIGFGGPADSRSLLDYASTIARARDAGLLVVAHAGEQGSANDVADATTLGVERVGHAIGLMFDAELYERARARGLVVESCPDSSIATGAVASFAEHPIDRWMRDGALVTLGTDDPALFDTELALQCLHLHRAFGWGPSEFERLFVNGALASRMPMSRRDALVASIGQSFGRT